MTFPASQTDALPLTATVTPADTAAAAEAVRAAGSQGQAVYPLGGGTRLDYGAWPQRPGVGLALAGLARLIDHPADDMTITVEAGMTIAVLQQQLLAHRQRLPVDVPQPERATVGGAVAVNAAGPRRYAYGTLRDYLLGFTAVDGTGTVFAGGGRVVKNAAGYNMPRLLAGSLGTLGVATQVTLMVRPLPEAAALLVCDVPKLERVEALLDALVHSAARPVAVELLAGRRSPEEAVLHPPENTGKAAARLYVGFEGPADEVQWMASQLYEAWRAHRVAMQPAVATDYAEDAWRQLMHVPATVAIHVLPSLVAATIAQVLELAPWSTVRAEAGTGVIHVGLARDDASAHGDNTQELANCAARLREISVAAGGTLVVTRQPAGSALTAADIWGPPGPALSVMQAMKDRFDPQNILNPGRFVFA